MVRPEKHHSGRPGQILAQAEGDKSKGPPSNGESENITGSFDIPFARKEDGTEESILANCKLMISVEDWGTGLIDGEQLIDCTADKEAPDNLGGHATWGGTGTKVCASGAHSYGMTAQNITMDDPQQNKFVCKYTFEAVCLEAGGKKPKEPCGCNGSSCSPDGGAPPPPPGRARAVEPPSPAFATSAAGSTVEALIDENGLLWSCFVANLRGLGTPLSGWLELTAENLSPILSTPSALAFRHPLAAELAVPEGGLVPGAKLELRLGARVIAFRCYEDGSIRPIGVDTAGLGRASLSVGEVPRFRWQNAAGEAWEFSGATGELLSYADKNGIVVSDVSAYLQIVRDGDGALRQIWSYWDGLLNIENAVLGGYTIALYTANQLAGYNETTGLYTLKEGATSFKRFVISWSAATFTITEQTAEREDVVRTWGQSTNGDWSLTTGVGEEAVTQTQQRTELEAGTSGGMLGVWHLVTSYAKGGIVAARTCAVYQTTPVGNLCLTRVEGYGSDAELTTTFEYDGAGKLLAETSPTGQKKSFVYDETGRVIRTSEPTGRTDGDMTTWHYHDATGLVTQKTYADGSQVSQTWDAFNRPATVTDARGITTTYIYETARGLLTGVSFSDSTPARAYGWNSVGKLITVTDASGTRTLSCNDYGEASGDTLAADGKTHTIEEQTDAFGRSSCYAYTKDNAVQQTTGITYDATGRIAAASFQHGGEAKTFAYGYLDGTRLIQSLAHPNGITVSYGYEAKRDLPVSMNATRGTTDVVLRGYTYDALARPSARSLARQASTRQDAFAYNTRSELTGVTLGTDAYGYTYDNIGNRKTAQELADELTYAANNLNQYASIATEGETEPFVPSFDADGNQTKIKTSTGIWTASYDAENRPVRFEKEVENDDGPTVIECGYDYLGRRYMKRVTQNGVVTKHERYIYRGYLQIAALDLKRETHPALWYVLWDPTEPIATRPLAIQKDGTWYTYGHDLTKNVWELYKANGTIASTYNYAPFGGVTANGTAEQPFQWSSEFYDAELGMVCYNYRFYNPLDGRWSTRDPIGENGGYALYSYSRNFPIWLMDFIGARLTEQMFIDFFCKSIFGSKRILGLLS